jgi:AraC-like DNA-binding protein
MSSWSRQSSRASTTVPVVRVERHDTESANWEVARRLPSPALRPYLLAAPEGWEQRRGHEVRLREVPIPGIPLILGLGAPWTVEDPDGRAEPHDSFVAGMHTRPALVSGPSAWACIELRLTPLGAHRLLGLPMHELANRTIELDEVLPAAAELAERLRAMSSWPQRFDLVESFLTRRLVGSDPPSSGVEWSWHHLRRTYGRAPIGGLADELGWSHRRLIARFREQIGLTPKTLARVIRFDHAVTALRTPARRELAEIALDCGYFDQAHLNRDFRELAGTTPSAFVAAGLESGGVAA